VTAVAKAPKVLAIVLAGGEGKRLMPLTAPRAKPAVPFGGTYRLVDFVLSNLVNSGFLRICVLTQYKSLSLDRHISLTWRMSSLLGNYVTTVPAQQRLGPRWYLGSADAIYQSLNLMYDESPDYVAVFGADHVYRMDASQMLDCHIDSGAGLTVAGIRVARANASEFGVIEPTADGSRINAFLEKPEDPPAIAGSPDEAFVSMGNYLLTSEVLVEALRSDAVDEQSKHDMGGDIVPQLVKEGGANVYDFSENDVPGSTDRDRGYWRDVGTIGAYHDAHLDLVSIDPVFNLYNRQWPIYSHMPALPGAKFVEGGQAHESIVSPGCVISGAVVDHSVLSPSVIIRSGATVEASVITSDVEIGRGATVRRAIIDKGVVVPDGAEIGVDHEHDLARGFTVSSDGITVVGKGADVPPP
jgi:glucose-1-phosphate adenylyltransferase